MNRISIVMRRVAVLGLAAAVGLLVAGVSTAAGQSANKGAPHFKVPQFTLNATIVIRSDEEHGKKGPDGKWHDAFLPANLTVLAGVPVHVTVYNYDDMPHTFGSTSLHLNAIIRKGSATHPSKTTFTFTPKKAGTYQWRCAPPCDPWSMAHQGYMRGIVKVVG